MPQATKQVCTMIVPFDSTLQTVDAFEKEVRIVMDGLPEFLRLDCKQLNRVDSSHIRILWDARSICHSYGVRLRLAKPTPALTRILTVLDLVDAFEFEEKIPQVGLRTDHDLGLHGLPRKYSRSVGVTIEDIDTAIAQFVACLTEIGVSANTVLELRTLFYEIATNIRLHSGMEAKEHFHISVSAELEELTISFTDSGMPFDPTVFKNRLDAVGASQNRQERGFGLPMIHKLADFVAYHRDSNSHNVVTVTKKWRH
jgi:anti-sigma regulatory factor (Ser/Thr protein kinase)/anti-anti-sigma regulatory factor